MKSSNLAAGVHGRVLSLLAMALLPLLSIISPASLHAAAPQRSFASPEEAVAALRSAAESGGKSAFFEIFGAEFRELLTGDEVLDANHAKAFANRLAEGCVPVKDASGKVTLEVGTNNWPMPIPLVMTNGQWRFDTAAGKEEIVNRHIGKDELHAIGVCRAYVEAQRQYAKMNPGEGGRAVYAQKFKSSQGKKDGLYWPAGAGEAPSPFGPLVAEAHAEGYTSHKGPSPHPFHGYYFRILTKQGKSAPGGKLNYLEHGALSGGFALVAYPENWDRSGIMTFIVNQDGQIFQRNLGPKTLKIAASMKEYNPDGDWVPVQDDGVPNTVSER